MIAITNLVSFVYLIAYNVKARHQLLEGAIGVFKEEEDAYQRVKLMSWLLPTIVLVGALLDLLCVMTYMWFLHPWICILSKGQLISK